VTRNEEPIQEVRLRNKLETGIEIDDIPGMIPRYYEMEACRQANYEYFGSWQMLGKEEKEDLVAHFILRTMIESHKDEVVAQEMKKKQKKK